MTTLEMKPKTMDNEKRFDLNQKTALGISSANLLLLLIVIGAAILHFYNIDAIDDANTYYTAAVESMLDSWHNFFFVAAEPGASVTVDKPPLGLWVEAGFAAVLGVSGFAVVLPNILAGLLNIPLIYSLVKRWFGSGAGLLAALTLAVTPVAIAANRNNTMDSMLTLVLLLAAWAFIKATETSKIRWLMLGAVIVGIGFNIKMLQAFLPVPAFFALYFFGAKQGWFKKTLALGMAGLLMLAVSLSWAVIVDLVPAESRPYIGSSQDNTVMELILGHNGLNRLLGGGGGGDGGTQDGGQPAIADGDGPQDGTGNAQDGQSGQAQRPNQGDDGQNQRPPNDGAQAQNRDGQQQGFPPQDGAQDGGPQDGGNQRISEVGDAGWDRFFSIPLAKELSWFLPFGLIGMAVLIANRKLQFPITSAAHRAFILWGGWLLTCLVFFSMASFFHAYYMVMLAPALAAMVGITGALLWRWTENVNSRAILSASLAVAATLAFQLYLVVQFGVAWYWMLLPVLIAGLGSTFLLISLNKKTAGRKMAQVGFILLMGSMLIVPGIWTFWTINVDSPNVNLPNAYAGVYDQRAERAANVEENNSEDELVDFLQLHTQGMTYMAAVPNAFSGAPLILETERAVLYMGGFSGSDPVIDTAGLQELVSGGELRYIFYGNDNRGNAGLGQWITQTCSPVPQFSQTNNAGPGNKSSTLYDCGG